MGGRSSLGFSNKAETVVSIAGSELYIYSKSKELVEEAKYYFENHYLQQQVSRSEGRNLMYSRAELIEISKHTLSASPPSLWESLKDSLPNIILKK